jgi:release factor glutamine methyltransferase
MNVLEALDFGTQILEGKKVESPRLSAELLAAYVLSLPRSQILSLDTRLLSPQEENQYKIQLDRRSRHEPIPYIIGEIEFYSIPLHISKGVLIPRPETETLVDAALEIAKKVSDEPKIYDLGTGSGAILIAMAMNLEDGEFWGSDVSNMAIQVASQNVRRHELQNYVELREGALFTPLRNELAKDFDMLVCNPPYIKTNDIQKLESQIKDFEPVIALDGGREGMTFIRSILDNVSHILKPGGYVFLEAEPSLMMTIRTEVRRKNIFQDFVIHKDASGKERVCQFRTKR